MPLARVTVEEFMRLPRASGLEEDPESGGRFVFEGQAVDLTVEGDGEGPAGVVADGGGEAAGVGAPEIGDPVEAAHAVEGDHHPALSGARIDIGRRAHG